MKVRPRQVLNAERISTEDQARSASIFPEEIGPNGWAGFIGDWLITKPNGETFIWPDLTFAQTYEIIDKPGHVYRVLDIWDGTGQFDFGQAIKLMHLGKKVRRVGWKDTDKKAKAMFISNTEPVFCVEHEDVSLSPIVGFPMFHSDLLATDWELVP